MFILLIFALPAIAVLGATEPCTLSCPTGASCRFNGTSEEQYCKCGGDQYLDGCGSLCEGKCQFVGELRACPFVCLPPACACETNFYRNENTNKCVPASDCPKSAPKQK